MQQIIITLDWPWLLGIFSTIILLTGAASSKFSRIEILLEHMRDKLSHIESRLTKIEQRF